MRRVLHLIQWLALVSLLYLGAEIQAAQQKTTYLVGVAKVDVTPKHRVLLAGYGGRRGESEGIDTPIWARALVIGAKDPIVLVAVDNCGVPAPVVESVAKRLHDRAGIKRERLVITATHTHNAPTLRGYAPVVWGGRTTPDQDKRVDQYTAHLTDKLVEVALNGLAARQAANLAWGRGRVTFGGNRRVLANGKWRGFGFERDGLVDHSLPIMVATDAKGKPIAIWVNYACHCTTVGSRNRIGGDWAGFANAAIEKECPHVIALTTIGCGADVGPQPSGNLKIAERHGQTIATEVKRLLATKLRPLDGTPSAEISRLKLPFAKPPALEHWQRTAKAGGFHGYHAKLMLKTIRRDGKLPAHLDYPVTVWKFGDELAVVFLPGEVVVDYAVRLNVEMDWTRLWITAWSNDVPCYIPSRRVLGEGGYEADFSMIYYARPARFAANVEEVLVSGVKKLLDVSFRRRPGQKPPTFHRLPSSREIVAQRLQSWVQSARLQDKNDVLRHLSAVAPGALDGFRKLVHNDGSEDRWFDYKGTKRMRPFIRQKKKGHTIRWETTPVKTKADKVAFLFLGGVGWVSQPQTDGFALVVGDKEVLRFDVTRQARGWHTTPFTLLGGLI